MSSLLSTRTISTAGTEEKKMFHGIYTASVVSTQDPSRLSRVTLKIPQVLGSSTSNWAAKVSSTSDVPSVNSIVYAMFTGGDVNKPVYLN